MGWSYENREGDEEEEEEDLAEELDAVSDNLLLLIFAAPSMLEPDSSGVVPVVTALKVGLIMMKQKIITNKKDKVGILFYGVDKAKNPDNEEEDIVLQNQVYEFQKLSEPTAKRIRELDSLSQLDNKDLAEELRFQWTGEGTKFNTAIRACYHQFGNLKQRDRKRIFIFTNEEVPSKDSDPRASITDALETGVGFELWYSSPKGRAFDQQKYWDDVLLKTPDLEDLDEEEKGVAKVHNASESLDKIEDEARRQVSVKRRYAKMPFTIAGSPPISMNVALFKDIGQCRLPPAVQLTLTHQKVKTESKYMTTGGDYVPDTSIKTGVSFGGTYVPISRDEYSKASSFGAGPAGIDLLGFVPTSELTWDMSVSGPTFVYPDESDLRGSTAAFVALHASMVKRGCMALVCYRRTPTAAPKLAVLLPQEETANDPPGLQLILVPWLDDIRRVPPDLCTSVKEDAVEAAKAVVKKLEVQGFPLKTTEFPNPAIQKHYSVLEGLALQDTDSKVWDDDKTLPPVDKMLAAAENELDEFSQACGLTEEAEGGGGGKKRKTPCLTQKAEGSGAGKKPKKSSSARVVDVTALVREGTLESMTVAELKEVAESLGLVKGGKKADIVERITNYELKRTSWNA